MNKEYKTKFSEWKQLYEMRKNIMNNDSLQKRNMSNYKGYRMESKDILREEELRKILNNECKEYINSSEVSAEHRFEITKK